MVESILRVGVKFSMRTGFSTNYCTEVMKVVVSGTTAKVTEIW